MIDKIVLDVVVVEYEHESNGDDAKDVGEIPCGVGPWYEGCA